MFFSTVNTLSWCKNLPSFKQQNDHKKYKYYTAIKHTADLKNKEVLLIEVWAYKYFVMLHGVNLLAKKKTFTCKHLIPWYTYKKWIQINAPSSKDSVLSLCFLFSAMTSFSDHFWPKKNNVFFIIMTSFKKIGKYNHGFKKNDSLQFSFADLILRSLTNVYSEHWVRSTGLFIHLSWPCVSNGWARLKQTHYIIEGLTLHLPRPNYH